VRCLKKALADFPVGRLNVAGSV
jgi:hypothetical protein